VSIVGENSTVFDLLLGTVHGSILGPILYAIFIAPLFDLECLEGFTDNIFIQSVGSSLKTLIYEKVTKWCSQSGLMVNHGKTQICLFQKRDIDSVGASVGPDRIITIKKINILGIIFDFKLQWSAQVC
jgi:hypothetical protein